MLRPEPMLYFRIIVPDSYQTQLIDSLVSLGAVHLNPHAFKISLSLPPLLQGILEKRISAGEINVDHALSIVRKSLRPDDKLRIEFEERYKEYKTLEKIQKILLYLKEWNIHPIMLKRKEKLLIFRLVEVSQNRLSDLINQLRKLKVAYHYTTNIEPNKAILIIALPRHELKEVNEILMRNNAKIIKLPESLYTTIDRALELIEKRILEKKREIMNILVEVAELVRAAIEFEYTYRLELLDHLNKWCKSAEEELEKIKRVLTDITTLNLYLRFTKGLFRDLETKCELPSKTFNLVKDYYYGKVRVTDILDYIPSEYISKVNDFITKLNEIETSLHFIVKLPHKVKHKEKEKIIKLHYALKETLSEILRSVVIFALTDKIVRESDLAILSTAIGEKELGELWELTNRLLRKEVTTQIPEAEDRFILLSELFDKIINYNEMLQNIIREINYIKEQILSGERVELNGKIPKYLSVIKNYLKALEELLRYEPFIESLLKAQSLIGELRIFRHKRVCIAEGWIPKRYAHQLEEKIKREIPRVIYFSLSPVKPGQQAPIQPRLGGFLRPLLMLTYARGIPNYWEVDPSIIFLILFNIMYGMMFGDVGLGAIIMLGGLWLYKTKKKIFDLSEESRKFIGLLAFFCGISSIFFGIMYGIAFLMRLWPPLWLSPFHDAIQIIKVALIFGVIQLILALVINIINCLLIRDYYNAIFSGTGVLGLAYYIIGIFLAYNIAKSNFDFSVMFTPSLLPFTLTLVIIVITIPISRILGSKFYGKGEAMESITELIEMLIAYPANSLSYVRLAAFAIAHEVFGIFANTLASTIGFIPSLIIANLFVLVLEGFIVGIQSVRLLYYEFSTKFLRGDGFLFKPLYSAKEYKEMR